jgi:hypothetical protein
MPVSKSRVVAPARYRFRSRQTRELAGEIGGISAIFAVLDLTVARIVNGADCEPLFDKGGRYGAIAQLGERIVRNDEVGGSIPPGSTTLRPSGFAWRSRAEGEGRSVPCEASSAKQG